MPYERKNIERMTGYTPGEQPESADVVKLNTNENPYPPTDAVMRALHDVTADSLRRYPPPLAQHFREAAAAAHGVKPKNILATNAGDELLRLAVTTFVDPHEKIGTAEPSYSLYPVLAEVNDSPMVRVPLDADWSLPRDYAQQLNAAGVKLAFVVNPHAPSGTLTKVDDLARLAAEFRGVLFIDEAYIDFVDPELKHSAVPLVNQFQNVLLLRTLSKGYSLAGLRFGYAIGSANLIAPMLTKTKDSYNTDAVAQKLAVAAIASRADAAKSWQAVRSERVRVVRELAAMGLTCPPSQSNFVLAMHPAARALYESLKARHIYVRYFDQDRLRDQLRITIGTPAQNDTFLAALKKLI